MPNPEKISQETLQICPPHLSNVATLPWEIQTSYFSTLLFIYFRLFTLPQKKTNSNCHTAALAVYYYCLVLPAICVALVLRLGHSTGGARVLIWTCWACSNSLLRHGLNFSTAWCSVRLITVEKDWKHVLMQKVVTVNTCCDIACLTFHSCDTS